MNKDGEFEIFLMTAPGLEQALYAEVRERRYKAAKVVPGGVMVRGGWPEVWRANLELRGAGRVIARIASFRVPRLADLERQARDIDWAVFLRRDQPVRVEATCRQSRIYHSGAAEQRIAEAIAATIGAPTADDADVTIRARIENDHCVVGIDTSGELLHRRGYKEAVAKAPMRETFAALFLRQCGYDGREPVLDPMCGSGTFVIEAAEWAAGLKPGRARKFAFEKLATFDAEAWRRLRDALADARAPDGVRCHGSDRDAGAVAMAMANAERAGVAELTEFRQLAVSEIVPPEGPPGLVIANPPYGTRIGDKGKLVPLYRAFGATLLSRFSGWRVGIVTTDVSLARATGLPFAPHGAPVAHGGLRVTLFHTGPLP